MKNRLKAELRTRCLIPERGRRGQIAVGAEGLGHEGVVRAVQPVPITIRRAEDADVGLAVAVEITGRGKVGGCAERLGHERTVSAIQSIPRSRRRPEDGDIGLAITVVIRRRDQIADRAEQGAE